jgi:hypothetical protein
MSRDDPKRILERLRSSHDVLGGSTPRAADEATDDPVEIWARRCGRGLAILASIVLVAWAISDVTGGLR